MSDKYPRVTNTGIYGIEKDGSLRELTIVDTRKHAPCPTDPNHFEDMVLLAEKQARRVIVCNGFWHESMSPDVADRAIDDAKELMAIVEAIYAEHLEDGQLVNVNAILAWRLGMTFQRMLSRVGESDTMRGVVIKAAARAGHAKTHGTSEEKAAKYRSYAEYFQQCIKEGLRIGEAVAATAKQFGVSEKTVRRARKQSND